MTGVVDNNGQLRHSGANRFATNSQNQEKIRNLYRFSSGHGGVQCEGCHGATHAIYPSNHTEDNLQSISVQGYAGTVAECTVCHLSVPLTASGGPHGMHTTGQVWVDEHGEFAEHGYAGCANCHGTDYQGSPLSALPVARQFRVEEQGTRQFAARYQIGCYDCHNGPDPDDDEDEADSAYISR